MKTQEELKQIVKDKYAEIAQQNKEDNQSSCCGATVRSKEVYNIMSDEYQQLHGYNPDADLALGCGLPTEFANISKGDTVLDLGSGAGNDCFVARHEVGHSGKVIGVDFTEAMIEKARLNADKLRYNNVEFRYGDIDQLPVSENSVDVVVSNCVLNLVPDKRKVFDEMYRVLKPGGHFSISDIVLLGDLPDAFKENAEMYAGCVSGAIQKSDYLQFIEEVGFANYEIQKEKPVLLPDDILLQYLDKDALADFRAGNTGIYSITLFAQKPGNDMKKPKIKLKELLKECAPSSGCC